MISFKRIIQITIPLIIGGLSTNLVNLTDTVFLGQLGAVELGSGGNASIFYFIFAYVGTGFSTGMQILIARRNGEGNFKAINEIFQAGLFLIALYSILGFFFIHLGMNFLIPEIYESEAVSLGTQEYLKYRSVGLIFTLFNFAMIAFYVGITETRILAWIIPLTALLNIILDYYFIFGFADLPAMGIKGAAIASVISEAFGSILLLVFAYRKYRKSKFQLFSKSKLRKSSVMAIVELSYPLLAQNFITLSAWFVFFSLIENFGEKELAVSHIIRSIYGFLMLPSFSLADAANSLVSNLIGEKQEKHIYKLIGRILIIGLVFNIICIGINLSFESQILGLFTEDTEIIAAAGNSFLIINFALIFLTFAMVLFRSLTGTGLTKVSLGLEIASVAIYLGYAFTIVSFENRSLTLLWSSEFIYFGMIAVLSFTFLRLERWKGKAI